MAGLLTLTVLSSRKLRDKLGTAFTTEEKQITKLMENEALLLEHLTSDKDSSTILALRTLIHVRLLAHCSSTERARTSTSTSRT
jgi:hypothetical protein